MTQRLDSGSDNLETLSWQYQPGPNFRGFPWDGHKLPFKFTFEGISGSLDKGGDIILYRRETEQGKLEKTILTGKGSIYFCPVEPFHHPADASQHLLINFDQQVLLEPRATRKIFLTFPIEIALILVRKGAGETVLDLFSLLQPKLSLYGTVKNGLVCRYWQSNIHQEIPHLNPLAEGVLQLIINNSGNRWTEISKAVFSAQGMKIYFDAQLVAMQATMKINNEITAETAFIDGPLKKGMRKAPEQFSASLLKLPGRLVMEEGY